MDERKQLALALLGLVLVLALGEGAMRFAEAKRDAPHSYDVDRAPHYRRDWWAFTAPRDRGDAPLVLILSNSQGFGPELGTRDDLGHAEAIYAARLRERLQKNHPDAVVANWSVAGGNGVELALLAARAVQHKPDVVFIVSHMNTWTKVRIEQPLSFYISDVNQFAYQPAIRDALPGWFRAAHPARNPTDALLERSAWAQAGRRWVEPRDEAWLPRRVAPPRREPAARSQRSSPPDPDTMRTLAWSARVIRDANPDAAVFLVSMPLNRPAWKPGAWQAARRFGNAVREAASRSDAVAVDAYDELGRFNFYTHAHLNPRGHRAFAAILAEHAEAALVPPSE